MFILQCHKFLVVPFIVDLVAWFWFWVQLIFLFLKLWCLLYFHIWVHTCVLVPYKFFFYNFHCVFEVSLLFSNSSLGFLYFHCYCAGWNLSQKLILWVKNSKFWIWLVLSVEKKWKKSTSKLKIQKKWKMKYEQSAKILTLEKRWCGSDLEKNIKIIWLTVLVKFQCLYWSKTLKFLWLKFQAQFWSILSSMNLGSCEKFTQKFFVVLFWFYSSILAPFTRIPLCVLPFLVCLNFLLVNVIEYS